jgi:hypothetical protein
LGPRRIAIRATATPLAATRTPARLANTYFHGEIIAMTTRKVPEWILKARRLA